MSSNYNFQLILLCREYAPDDPELEKLEEEARKEKRGLWQDENPILPWEWRKREK